MVIMPNTNGVDA